MTARILLVEDEAIIRMDHKEEQERLAARRIVEQAAALLQKKYGLTEGESYRKISMLALRHRKPLCDIAEAILFAESLSTDKADTPPPQQE